MGPRGKLTSFQSDVLVRFFADTPGFFLTGGAVLCGWELAHRTTDDLDLFTSTDDALPLGDVALKRIAADLGCAIRPMVTSPDFHRYELRQGGELLIVDLVRDRVPQLRAKVERDGIAMDTVEEIFVNKICALVGRSEIRDLVDLRALEAKGLRVEDYVELAQKKDGGATAATIAWILSVTPIPDDLKAFAKALELRMLAVAKRDAE